MDEPTAQPQANEVAQRRTRSRTLRWLAVWVALTAAIAFKIATAWPSAGQFAELLLLVTGPGIVSRLLDLGAIDAAGRLSGGGKRFLRRGFAIVLGLPLAGAVLVAAGSRSNASFEKALVPLVDQVHAQAAAPCPPQAKYLFEPALRDYLDRHLGRMASVPMYHDAQQRFVLRFPGRSIDIDGSTVWYDSSARRWSRFHNDLREPRDAFQALVAPMTECRLPLR